MVERAVLTKKIVDEAKAPLKGERWIADTKVRGFGLRVWRNRSGGIGKGYCVRVRDDEGHPQRRTFVPWTDVGWHDLRGLYLDESTTIGDFSEFARQWAIDQIDLLKGRLTLEQEMRENQEAIGQQLGRTPLDRAMQAYIRGRRSDGLTLGYLDRIDKLFSRFVPRDVRAMPISAITSEMITSVLESRDLSPGNLRVLRPVLRDLFRRYRNIHWGRNVADDASTSLVPMGSADWPATSTRLPVWEEEQFRTMFKWLESSADYWQQRLCLSLFMRVYNVPMTSAMAARWDQFYLVKIDRSSFSPGEQQELPAWYWGLRPWKRHVFRTREDDLLDALWRTRSASNFLFPSQFGRGTEHI
jgi:hypothetical protein